jgi:hypothetical protein
MTFLMKTSATEKFVKIFYEAFLIFKKYFASTIRDLFSFLQKRLFNSQAVRIGLIFFKKKLKLSKLSFA